MSAQNAQKTQKIVTAEQMREIDRRSAEEGVPGEVLMENAGLAVAKEVKKFLGSIPGSSIIVLAGPGNNGGDGLVAARHLHDWGANILVYLYSRKMEGDKNFELVLKRDISLMNSAQDENFSVLNSALSSADLVVDALFGTGKLRPLKGDVKEVLNRVSETKKRRQELKIVALDLPSGLDADSGAVDPSCLTADLTVTLGYPKIGLFGFPGAEKIGKLVICDIGFPPKLAEGIETELLTSEWVKEKLPRRPLNANKGTFGKVLVVGGSINYIGAPYMACEAAIRVGAGLVTLALAGSLQPVLATKLTEVTYIPLPEAEQGVISAEATEVLKEQIQNYDVLLLGCGLGQNPQTADFVKSFLPLVSKPLVLDADGLNILAKGRGLINQIPSSEVVLTPHPGEMSRLTGLSVPEIQKNRLEVARRFATEWRKVVVLKGAFTVIASPSGEVKLSPFANPGLASAGTGDVLAGAIVGLLAQGLSTFDAASVGVYLHGTAGELVKSEIGDAGMVATDLLPKLPLAIRN